jgi:hypothetical protein
MRRWVLTTLLLIIIVFLGVDIRTRILFPVGRYERMDYDASGIAILDTTNGKVLFLARQGGERKTVVIDTPSQLRADTKISGK